MKHLKEYILEPSSSSKSLYEGIFDPDIIKDTHVVDKQLFDDSNSEFWKFCVPVTSTWGGVWSIDDLEKSIDTKKNIINLDTVNIQLNTKNKNPLTNEYTLYCNSISIGDIRGRGPRPGPIDNGGGFKDIYVKDGVNLDGTCEEISGFKFHLDSTSNHGYVYVNWTLNLKLLDADFDFSPSENSIIVFRDIWDFPDLKKVTSNTKNLKIYSCGLFDNSNIKSKLDKFFGSGTIQTNGIDNTVKNKTIRNIIAIGNNMRKYGAIVPTEIIPEGKLSDLIDVRGFKNLEKISMENNNVCIYFVREDHQLIKQHAQFVRLNNMKLYKDYSLDDMIELVKKCKTKDGWVVLVQPDRF